MFELNNTSEVIRYYHASKGFPTKNTWLKPIKSVNYTPWPGLTSNTVQKHFPESEDMYKGNIQNTPLGFQSTKINIIDPEYDKEFGTETRPKEKHIYIFISAKDLKDELVDTIYSDQADKLSVKSSNGNQYIMVI